MFSVKRDINVQKFYGEPKNLKMGKNDEVMKRTFLASLGSILVLSTARKLK